jgi:hypothetical protein
MIHKTRILTILVFVLILASNQFFGLLVFPDSFISLMNRLSLVLLLVFAVKAFAPPQSSGAMDFPYVMILAGIYANVGYSWVRNGVAPMATIINLMPFLFIMIYSFLNFKKFDMDVLRRIAVLLGVTYGGIYLIQLAIYPSAIIKAAQVLQNSVGDEGIAESRGTLRFRGAGGAMMMLAYFLCLGRYLFQEKKESLLVAIFLLTMLVFGGFRSLVVSALIVSIFFYFRVKGISLKNLAGLLGFVLVVSVAMFLSGGSEVITGMLEETKGQSSARTEDIRVIEFKYYVFELPKYAMDYVFGVGYPSGGGDSHNRFLQSLSLYHNLFWQDIGIFGLSMIAGPLVGFGLVASVIKGLRIGTGEVGMAAASFLLYLLLGSLTSSEMYRTGTMGVIGVAFYLISARPAHEPGGEC